jgi:hypothetical protein
MRGRIGVLTAALALACASAADARQPARWLAGDLHVHTCFSHDAYCGPGDDNSGPDVIYSSGGTVAERFAEARAKGLDFLAITDHEDVRAQSDPDFGAFGVTALPAYEASLQEGHAQMLGAQRVYEKGSGDAASAAATADALRADGGVFQANHPSYRMTQPFERCEDTDVLHWRYGYAVRPDLLEVWNTTALIEPARRYWECWLDRGERIGISGGSDSHGASQANLALPTTWVRARARSPRAILAALRAGRTTISRLPPALGGARLLLEADRDRDGRFESRIGDRVPLGTPMRVRSSGPSGAGLVRVRANGRTIVHDAALRPGGRIRFRAPAGRGWAYATLHAAEATRSIDPGCLPGFGQGFEQPVDTCSADLATLAMTSPVWIRRR